MIIVLVIVWLIMLSFYGRGSINDTAFLTGTILLSNIMISSYISILKTEIHDVLEVMKKDTFVDQAVKRILNVFYGTKNMSQEGDQNE